MSLIPILYSIVNCLKRPFISKLINLNYTFTINLKAIRMRTSSQFQNGEHLKILPISVSQAYYMLSKEILL